MTDNKALTDRFWNRFESGRLDDLASMLDPACHFKMPGAEFRGIAALQGLLAAYREAFPDLRHTVKSHVSSGDTIALELEVTGTHTGPMQTPQGTIPATGKRVTWESCDYVRIENERIVSWHVYHDPQPFLSALGVKAG